MRHLILLGTLSVTIGCSIAGKHMSFESREPAAVTSILPKAKELRSDNSVVEKAVYGIVEVDTGTIVQFRKTNKVLEGIKQDVILIEQCRPFETLKSCNPVRTVEMPYDAFVNRLKLLVRTGGFAAFPNAMGEQIMVQDALKGNDPNLQIRTKLMAEQRAEWIAEADRMERWLKKHGVSSTKVADEIERLRTLISDRTREIGLNDQLLNAAEALDGYIFMIMDRIIDPQTEYMLVNGRDNTRIEYYLLSALREASWISSQFVKINSGSYMRYSPPKVDKRGDLVPGEPLGTVEITRPFEISNIEVTQYDFLRVMGQDLKTNPAKHRTERDCRDLSVIGDIPLCPLNPIENVSRADIEKYIQALNQRDRHFRYRLPTEAEWELAARAGSMGRYTFNATDSKDMDAFAWTHDNTAGAGTLSVALKARSNGSLYDIHGNVAEIVDKVFDCGGKVKKGRKKLVLRDPARCASTQDVSRGGSIELSWEKATLDVSSPAYLPNPAIGFRLVREPK